VVQISLGYPDSVSERLLLEGLGLLILYYRQNYDLALRLDCSVQGHLGECDPPRKFVLWNAEPISKFLELFGSEFLFGSFSAWSRASLVFLRSSFTPFY
jgi:hypothetical protein